MQINNELKDKLNKIIESKTFKFLRVVFWVVYIGAILQIIDTFAHIAICWSCSSLSYRVFYKIGLFFEMDKYEIYHFYDFLFDPETVATVIVMGFAIVFFSILIKKFILKKKIPLFWWIINILVSLCLILSLISYIKDELF